MVKPTNLTKDHSGDNSFYEYENGLVKIYPEFIYEVCLYKYWKNGYCQLGSKLYKSNHLLHIKDNNIINKYLGFFIEKEISLIGVPKEFIEECKLKQYKPIIKKHKKKCKKTC